MGLIKKVLITGGNGYIGARLSLYLANRGYEVTSLCFPSIPKDEVWKNKMAMVLCGDIRDENFLKEISANTAYDAVIHLVSLDHHQSCGNPSFVSSVNITPTWNLLDVFSKVNCKKFLYLSTMQVYGKLPAETINENYSPEAVNVYALTHLISEQFCEYYNRTSQTRCHIVRLSNSYGAPIFVENNCWWLVINELCRMAYTKQSIVLQSDGLPQRDFIHGWDVVKAIEIILKNGDDLIYNVSSGTTLTIVEIAWRIKQVYQTRFNKIIDIILPDGNKVEAISKPSFPRYIIDNTILMNIGYEPEWNLDRGINDLFDFIVQNE